MMLVPDGMLIHQSVPSATSHKPARPGLATIEVWPEVNVCWGWGVWGGGGEDGRGRRGCLSVGEQQAMVPNINPMLYIRRHYIVGPY